MCQDNPYGALVNSGKRESFLNVNTKKSIPIFQQQQKDRLMIKVKMSQKLRNHHQK